MSASALVDTYHRDNFLSGGKDYNHADDSEYKNFRSLANEANDRRAALSEQSQKAYKRGDKEEAHQLSVQAKKQQEKADEYNLKASEYAFRENNTDSKSDEIDLHGLYVKEAEYFLSQRIQHDCSTNQTHLKVIVGKGIHSANHIPKIKLAVDQMCTDMKLSHKIDPKNAGVIIINYSGGQQPAYQQPQYQQQSQYQQPQYQQQQQPQYQQQQHNNNNNNNNNSALVGALLSLVCWCIKNNR